ncbi:hypothetical protein [Pelotomaculum propionicicum]|uniref:Uncharacterized protein n=1 Tax=Pelotomaculum propionicicum TaxID=258475 RepID=A0A4Y7RWX7_9FIRM|nr:hypothetical protein [Pelotomaculum propionicicum]TEB12777.1 hypothetical protein Pmgp_00753 [Pelotomaculum propionicicum]
MNKVVNLYPDQSLLAEYQEYLAGKSERTTDAYIRVLRQFTSWIAEGREAVAVFIPSILPRRPWKCTWSTWKPPGTA